MNKTPMKLSDAQVQSIATIKPRLGTYNGTLSLLAREVLEHRKNLARKEMLLEKIRVRAMQTDWMENLTNCLAEALGDEHGGT